MPTSKQPMMVIGVGGIGVINGEHVGIKTFALGSCVAVMLYDPVSGFVGMVHVALPCSQTNLQRACAMPGYFADTGVDELLKQASKARSGKRSKGYVVKVCGGASIIKSNASFNIGERNCDAVIEHLARNGLRVSSSDLGGTISRTVSIEKGTGHVLVSSPGRSSWGL